MGIFGRRPWPGHGRLLAFVLLLGACQGPVAPSNGLVSVINAGQTTASFHWQSPGLLGTDVLGASGTEPIEPCQAYARGFPPGTHRLTISLGNVRRSFVLDAPASGQTVLTISIGKDGTIAQSEDGAAPTSSGCG